MDKETQEAITDAEHVQNLIASHGWAIVKAKLDAHILDLQNIANIDMEKPDTLAVQVAARSLASQMLFMWLKNDVYGFVQQQQANNGSVRKPEGDDIIDLGTE